MPAARSREPTYAAWYSRRKSLCRPPLTDGGHRLRRQIALPDRVIDLLHQFSLAREVMNVADDLLVPILAWLARGHSDRKYAHLRALPL